MRRYLATPLWIMPVNMFLLVTIFWQCPARADNSSEKKRSLLAAVKRVAVVPAFFATDTTNRAEPARKTARGDKGQAAPVDARLIEYTGTLRKLADHISAHLPARVTARTPFAIVPAEEVTAALKVLEFSPESLFQNGARMRGNRYPLPDAAAVKKLAASLHADAVLLTALDEPRRKNGRYVFNLLSGVDYRNAQVEARGGFYVMMADGTTVLTDDIDVAHPLTHIGNREYLLVDWSEAEDVMIEDLLDEWTRYTPAK